MAYDAVKLTQELVRCPSVTPKDEGALVHLGHVLEAAGFTCYHLTFGEGEEAVPNLFARYGTEAPHICYVGHTDVVPPGPEDQWTYPPFSAHIDEHGVLYGRGASDMKGSVAAFSVAASQFIEKSLASAKPFKGSISLIVTGDEEGESINGTTKVLDWMAENGHIPDVSLGGEPTNPDHLGQQVKIGRRGTINGYLNVQGTQGHVAYQHLADNPIPRLLEMLTALNNHIFDKGSAYFPQTNLEITAINVDNEATNVIPESGRAMFNIRFSDRWTSETLTAKIKEILDKTGHDYDLDLFVSAESFLTQPGAWSHTVIQAVEEITGEKPEMTTMGGTSDARFMAKYCPVVEFGGINATIHQIDENAKVSDIQDLSRIFERVLELYFR